MGKGDKKSKRGKIILGTFGVRRRPKKSTFHPAAPAADKKSEVKEKKARAVKAEEVAEEASPEAEAAAKPKKKAAPKAKKEVAEEVQAEVSPEVTPEEAAAEEPKAEGESPEA